MTDTNNDYGHEIKANKEGNFTIMSIITKTKINTWKPQNTQE
jgi:hypothetical protein